MSLNGIRWGKRNNEREMERKVLSIRFMPLFVHFCAIDGKMGERQTTTEYVSTPSIELHVRTGDKCRCQHYNCSSKWKINLYTIFSCSLHSSPPSFRIRTASIKLWMRNKFISVIKVSSNEGTKCVYTDINAQPTYVHNGIDEKEESGDVIICVNCMLCSFFLH